MNREQHVYKWLEDRGEPATIDVIARGLRMSVGRCRIAVHALLRNGLLRSAHHVLWSAVPNLDGADRDEQWRATWAESKRMRAAGEFGWTTDKPSVHRQH